MDEAEFIEEIWATFKWVDENIPAIREEAHRIRSVKGSTLMRRYSGKRMFKPGELDNSEFTLTKIEDSKELEDMAIAASETAKHLQKRTESVGEWAAGLDILNMTDIAGKFLAWTEALMLAYTRLQSSKTKPRPDVVVPTVLVIVKSARDQLEAAREHSKNLRARIGYGELANVVAFLVPLFLIYLYLDFYRQSYYLAWRPYIVLVFWSIFGAIAGCIEHIRRDTMKEELNPRHIGKYLYRILVASIVAPILILALVLLGFVLTSLGNGGGGPLAIELANIPLIAVMAFVAGFFSERTISRLADLFPNLLGSTRSS